jgi:hypothetical protein
MAVLRKLIHKIAHDRWDEVVGLIERYEAVERRYGAPIKRAYRPIFGPHDVDTLIVEEEWESFAAMEETFPKAVADPDWQKVSADSKSVILTERLEAYTILK